MKKKFYNFVASCPGTLRNVTYLVFDDVDVFFRMMKVK